MCEWQCDYVDYQFRRLNEDLDPNGTENTIREITYTD